MQTFHFLLFTLGFHASWNKSILDTCFLHIRLFLLLNSTALSFFHFSSESDLLLLAKEKLMKYVQILQNSLNSLACHSFDFGAVFVYGLRRVVLYQVK